MRDAVEERKIGKHAESSAYEWNLRDLLRALDVIEENGRDVQFDVDAFSQLAADATSSSPVVRLAPSAALSISPDDPRLPGLRKFLELVYGGVYVDEDVRAVQLLIDDIFPVPHAYAASSAQRTIVGNEHMVRIGAVYMRKGEHVVSDEAAHSFTHTAAAVTVLEKLAAAAQSKRAVLLEGDTASGKSSCVHELARVCNRELVCVSLTADTETADLMGQWLPCSQSAAGGPAAGPQDWLAQLLEYLSKALPHLLLHCLPLLEPRELQTCCLLLQQVQAIRSMLATPAVR
jgi:hypothetical protein